MRLSYPQKAYPADLFTPSENSKKLLKLLDDLHVRETTDYDVATKTRLLTAVFDMLEDPNEHVSEEGWVEAWVAKYKLLWMRAFAEDMVTYGYPDTADMADRVYMMIARTFLTADVSTIPESLAEEALEFLDDEWALLFASWHACGRKEYRVSAGLSQKLLRTRIRGYPSKDLKLPYPCIYLDLRNYEGVTRSEYGEYDGCLLTQAESGHMSFSLVSDKGDEEFLHTLVVRSGEHATVDEIFDVALHHEFPKKFVPMWRQFYQYAVNIILYATMEDAESVFQRYDPTYDKLQKRLKKQKSPKKREKIKQQLKKTASAGFYYLGGSITVDRTEEQEPSQGFKGTRRITVRTLVSGHWRNQPCGPNKAETKRIWIEPFWRGPEGAPITQKIHSLR